MDLTISSRTAGSIWIQVICSGTKTSHGAKTITADLYYRYNDIPLIKCYYCRRERGRTIPKIYEIKKGQNSPERKSHDAGTHRKRKYDHPRNSEWNDCAQSRYNKSARFRMPFSYRNKWMPGSPGHGMIPEHSSNNDAEPLVRPDRRFFYLLHIQKGERRRDRHADSSQA